MGKCSFLISSLKVGGGTRVIVELANTLAGKHNLEIEIVLAETKAKNVMEVSKEVKVHSFGKVSNAVQLILNMLKAVLYTRKLRNVTISTGPIMSPLLLFYKDTYNYIQADDYTLFDDGLLIKNKLMLLIYKLLIKIAYRFRNVKYIFNSKFSYERFIEVSGRKDVPLNLVHPAVNHSVFYPVKSKQLRNQVVIGIIARKHPLKGFETFLRSYQFMENKDNLKIIVITHDDLSNFDVPKSMEVNNPKNDEELAELYRNIDVFVSTSYKEGFGLPALEAMACGCAVITSNSGGCLEYTNEENCLMYDAGNTKELAAHINTLVVNSNLRNQIIEKGIKTATTFTWDNSANQLLNIVGK